VGSAGEQLAEEYPWILTPLPPVDCISCFILRRAAAKFASAAFSPNVSFNA